MNFGIYNKKENNYEMMTATGQNMLFEIMIAEKEELIIIPEIKFGIAKSPATGEIVSIFEMVKEPNCHVLKGMAKT